MDAFLPEMWSSDVSMGSGGALSPGDGVSRSFILKLSGLSRPLIVAWLSAFSPGQAYRPSRVRTAPTMLSTLGRAASSRCFG